MLVDSERIAILIATHAISVLETRKKKSIHTKTVQKEILKNPHNDSDSIFTLRMN